MQNVAYQERLNGIKTRKERDSRLLADLENRRELMENLNDEELRIYQKNWYYGYHGKGAVWPATNFSDFPELKGDPVFQKILQLYEKFPFHESNEIKLSLSRFATDMANRTMKEPVYALLLEDKHPHLIKAYAALGIEK